MIGTQFIRRLARHSMVREQGKFFIVGAVSALLDFGLANLLAFVIDLDNVVASAVALLVVSVANFVLNRVWVFGRRGAVDLLREAMPFVVVVLVVLGLTSGVIWLADRWFGDSIIAFNAARIGGLGVIWLVKYFVFRHWVFADRSVVGRAGELERPVGEAVDAETGSRAA